MKEFLKRVLEYLSVIASVFISLLILGLSLKLIYLGLKIGWNLI